MTVPYVDGNFLGAAAYPSGTFTQGLVGADILLIAETRWYTGRSQDSLRIWAGLARVYGKQVVPQWAASMLE